MGRASRIVIVVVLIAAAGGVAYWYAVSRGSGGAEDAGEGSSSGPQAVMSGSELRHSEGGRLAWKVVMDQVELQSGGGTVAVEGLREGLVYDKQGVPVLRVSAQKVTADTGRQDFEMTGKVVVTSPKGMVITTDRVRWLNGERRLHCPGAVVMKAKRLAITTTGLDYLVDRDFVTCANQVRMYSGNNRLSGQSLTYNVSTGMVDIVGGIQMVVNPQEARQLLKELRKP